MPLLSREEIESFLQKSRELANFDNLKLLEVKQ